MVTAQLATLASASLALLPHWSSVGDLYVDSSAPNCTTGTGSVGDPVCNIADAVALAVNGDTIHIAPGTYVENLIIPVDLELRGTGGEAVTSIDGGASGSVISMNDGVSLTVDGLTVTGGEGTMGGGIRARGPLTVRNSTIAGNRSSGFGTGGGGIGGAGSGVSVLIENSTITENYAGNDVYTVRGGGVLVNGGSLEIVRSTIARNDCRSTYFIKGYGYGGGVAAVGSDVVIRESTIDNNLAIDVAGGLYLSASHTVLINTTVSNNHASICGGIHFRQPQPGSSMSHVTVTENSAYSRVGGVWVISPSTVELGNSIIAGNTSSMDPQDSAGPFDSQGYNFIGRGAGGITNGVNGDLAGSPSAPLDAVLGPLEDNGGPTRTHAPRLGSPLIDAANPASFAAQDQRGVARPIGSRADIGAVEWEESLFSTCNGDGGDQMGCSDCPCANATAPGTIGGCLNSTGAPMRLHASGDPSVSLPPGQTSDLRFSSTGSPSQALHILVSADAVASQNPMSPCFGLESGVLFNGYDGLRCAVFGLRRQGARTSDTNGEIGITNPPWGGEGAPPAGLAVAFGGFSAGQVRYFQAIFRDDPLLVCMRGLNTSQAIEVEFRP